jgi:NAD(P)H-dependent FMN reductase
MSGEIKLLAFAGSTRAESHNKKLLRLVAKAAGAAGASVTMLELADLALPLYDGDLEQAGGIPEGGLRLKAAIAAHDGLLIASPEYNGGLSAVLKNALDWASRRDGDEPALASYKGKVAAIVGASPGRLGGARGLIALRQVLTSCGVLVIPTQFALAEAQKAFDDVGRLIDAAHQATVDNVAKSLVETAAKLKR